MLVDSYPCCYTGWVQNGHHFGARVGTSSTRHFKACCCPRVKLALSVVEAEFPRVILRAAEVCTVKFTKTLVGCFGYEVTRAADGARGRIDLQSGSSGDADVWLLGRV